MFSSDLQSQNVVTAPSQRIHVCNLVICLYIAIYLRYAGFFYVCHYLIILCMN